MALAANAAILPRHVAGSLKFEGTYKSEGADEYYMGAIVCLGNATGKLLLSAADGRTTLGICMDRVTAAAADDPVRVNVRGYWWIAAAGCADATLGDLMSPLVTSDDPAARSPRRRKVLSSRSCVRRSSRKISQPRTPRSVESRSRGS